MLADIYGWFTEGFDTADLKDAKALLDELDIGEHRARLVALALLHQQPRERAIREKTLSDHGLF